MHERDILLWIASDNVGLKLGLIVCLHGEWSVAHHVCISQDKPV